MALAVGALKEQIEKAKENLKGVEENIVRITGRDPNEKESFDFQRYVWNKINAGSEHAFYMVVYLMGENALIKCSLQIASM